MVFSSRPIDVKERIYLRISSTADCWHGGLRVGFTYIDPATMEGRVPNTLVPSNPKRFLVKTTPVESNIEGGVIYFYLSMSGNLVISSNGKKKKLYGGLNTRAPLWAAIEVYGNCTGVQLVDRKTNFIDDMARLSMEEEVRILPIRFNASKDLSPLLFHSTRGKNVHLSNGGCIASRTTSTYEQGYVFTLRPIKFGERIIIQVLKSDDRFSGSLAFGLTSCNPASLRQTDLPDDADKLLDRPEYWVVTKNVSSSSRTGDEIALYIEPNGDVTISKNGAAPVLLMTVDVTLQLWAFMDIYGSTESIRIFKHITCHRGIPQPVTLNYTNGSYPHQVSAAPSCASMISAPSTTMLAGGSMSSQIHENRGFIHSMTSAGSCSTMMSAASSTTLAGGNSRIINVPAEHNGGGGTVLVLNLPSTSQNIGTINGLISASQVGFLYMKLLTCF